MPVASVPTVSVIMPSYNHARFIPSAITSILDQTFFDLELIIVDDGSADDSVDVIKTFVDSRIRTVFSETNQGAAAATNKAVSLARGTYVALCNSDDRWAKNKLDVQLSIFKNQPDLAAVFSDVAWIDSQGAPLDPSNPSFSNVFQQENRNRHQWLHDLLLGGNCLCHPSILIKRDALNHAGPYDNRFRQLPDLEKWIALVQFGEIFVSPEKLIEFRIHESNTSAANPDTNRRTVNEFRLIVRDAFYKMSADNFAASFGLKAPPLVSETHLKIEKALFLIAHRGAFEHFFREAGLDLMHELLASDDAQRLLSDKYGYNVNTFYSDMGASSPWIVDPKRSVGADIDLTTIPTRHLANQVMKRGLEFMEAKLKRSPK
ncbi:glycosyl transferase, family 2 [Afipia carboxidovorans OM5]|uniref:Glycosyl transferase n=1 Tax=Afipia carboxidovorans (strain ATCC 49405 / DSM 1227 / KCTC 32145 / OM5) TaxID=504832 RepID=B6JCX3_AFIC5|nr:glycosyltransferase [Afipia carboxidovorans]ACI91703.1 glycosyl transferase, family 2 [Afipia carboxidovorans OM5]AEI04429.1 glycosyl transferase [Afipia carboxidovorans OM4]AEI08059.1 glycosyl transferase [Afipia carboxidovorans OM5]